MRGAMPVTDTLATLSREPAAVTEKESARVSRNATIPLAGMARSSENTSWTLSRAALTVALTSAGGVVSGMTVPLTRILRETPVVILKLPG